MIKNLLYSIFLHSILLLTLYFVFKNNNSKKDEEIEIAVTLGNIAPAINNSKATQTEPLPIKKPERKIEKLPKEKKIPEEKKSIKKNNQPTKEEKPKIIDKPILKKEIEKTKITKEAQLKEEKPSKQIKPKDEAKIKEQPKPEITKKPEEEKIKEQPKPEITKKEEEKIITKPPIPEAIPDSKQDSIANSNLPNSLENINLSPREKFNIQSQLNRCYKKTVNENKPKIKITVVIKAEISENGYIESNLDNLIDIDRYNNSQELDYKIAIDNVKKAIALCSPLRNLPLDKHDIWKEISIEFDEDGLR